MFSEQTRPMNDAERRALVNKAAHGSLPVAAGGTVKWCLVWIGAVGLIVLVAAGLIYLLGTPLNRRLFPLFAGPLLGMLGVGGVLCLYALIACILGFFHWGRVFRRFRRDEAPKIQGVRRDGIVTVKTVSATAVIELEELEEGSGYIFDIGEGRSLLLKGRRYFPVADDMPWPNSGFEIVRSVDGKVLVGILCSGSALEPVRTIAISDCKDGIAFEDCERVVPGRADHILANIVRDKP